MQPNLIPVRVRHTLQDGVYQQLRHALMTGQYDPDQRLTITALAESFETSHMPVREALRRLIAENALEQSANGSARVPPVNRQRLDDLCQARVAIEGLAAELAASRLTARDLKRIEALRVEHEEAGARDGVYSMLLKNQEFHFYIYRASGSEVLPQLIESLWLRFGPFMRLVSHHLTPTLGTPQFRNGAKFHKGIVAALKAGDPVAARHAIEADIRATQAMIGKLISDTDARSIAE